MADLLVVLAIAAVAGSAGLVLGIVVIAPRITRALDRSADAEETRDGPD